MNIKHFNINGLHTPGKIYKTWEIVHFGKTQGKLVNFLHRLKNIIRTNFH